MARRKEVLIITYAVPEELEVDELREVIESQKKNWFCSLPRWRQWLLNRFVKMYDREVVLIETGIGKINAFTAVDGTLKTIRKFVSNVKITVVNLGTAASINVGIGNIVECTRFVDRDLANLHYFDSPDDYTLYTQNNSLEFSESRLNELDNWTPKYSCNSGDSFVTDPEQAYQIRDGWTAVCDMEGYATALAVIHNSYDFPEPIKFKSHKYITDVIGEDNNIEGWEEELPAARLELTCLAQEYIRDFYNS